MQTSLPSQRLCCRKVLNYNQFVILMFQPIKWLKPIFTGLPKPSTPSLVLNVGITFLMIFNAPFTSAFNVLSVDVLNKPLCILLP